MRTFMGRHLANAIGLAVVGATVASAQTLTYSTTDPEIEMWFYPTGSSNGLGSVRDRGSSFATYSFENDHVEIEFYGGDGFDPTRRGSTLIAANTSTVIPRLAPSRYQIDSLTIGVTLIGSIGTIVYDNTPEDMLQLTTVGGDDPGNPIEMWGVGFDGAYTTFGFADEMGAEFFNSGDRRWPISGGAFVGPYQVYAIDGEGRDVENAVFGGYSATAPDNAGVQFTPSPFAIGKAYDEQGVELTPGSALGAGTQLEFAFSLNDPGVVNYLQNSLSAGHLGVFLSSLHEPLGHTGTVAYPDYFLDNVLGGPNPNGAGPTIELSVTILPPPAPGDYNGDGGVDGLDFLAWQRTLGSEMIPAGSGADGDGSGWVDGADLGVWSTAFDAAASGGVSVVPEPIAAVLLGLAGVALTGARRSRWQGGEPWRVAAD